MVASSNGDPYTPFPHLTVIEDGVQSSEEGSDLHSPVYEPSYASPDGRYPLGPFHYDSVATQLLPPPSAFDARYPAPAMDPHSRDHHIIETLQVPSPTTIHHHLSPPHLPADLSLHTHSMLDMAISSPRLHSGLMNSSSEYSIHLSQHSRVPEHQLRLSADPTQSFPSRQPTTVPTAEPKPQISLSSASGPVRGTSSGSNPSPTRPPRREASTVVIACRQCRARKIRCDSTRPFCHNCVRRNNECEYDAVPKRRGPDKRPGTRQRSCKKRPLDADPTNGFAKKKRRTSSEGESDALSFDAKVKENVTGGARRGQFPSRGPLDDTNAIHIPPLYIDTSMSPRETDPDAIYPKDELSPSFRRSSVIMDYSDPDKAFARPVDVNISPHLDQDKLDFIPLSSPVDAAWWDELLDQYNPESRDQSLHAIVQDLQFLFNHSGYWLSFINVDLFFEDLHNPQSRGRMEPVVMSGLAMAILMKSSEMDLGGRGRELALTLRDRSQACLELACRNQALDYSMAEAALILALFESSAHPLYSPERAKEALQLMDQIIHVLSLPSMDRDDPSASSFRPREVPMVDLPDRYETPSRCRCPPPATGFLVDSASLNLMENARWDQNASVTEIRKEECRRLCWCALTLVSAYTAQCSAFHTEPAPLNLAEPSKYALLFPGEAFERAAGHQQTSGQSPKESVWALYCRSMLLWNSYSCIQRDEGLSTDERARFAIDAFQEAQAIQDALDMHLCNSNTALIYIAREYLYNTRMTITYELRRLQDGDMPPLPMFNRRQAEEWLLYQEQVAKRAQLAVTKLNEPQGQQLSRRPFQVTWFASQVAICLGLWEYNHSLTHALDLAKAFLVPLEALNLLWPCPEQGTRKDELRRRLEAACSEAMQHPPPSAEVTMPSAILRRGPASAM
ncbi:uncharacterized protein BXZ73DRAFT_88637 [Epithele typhae]|uniref:uncharacterized protein n=1 Tax=Epithele typhae TaxID=378194 RepID=UPI0020076396|nr:uncharacterized protein BXZ73DRAFT_88637 [Epithele typhae]KAH9940377.1 hypothetical protein BXZ73DRAFT_88637 [Epithele typhae]